MNASNGAMVLATTGLSALEMALMAMASPFDRIRANRNKGRIDLSTITNTACFLQKNRKLGRSKTRRLIFKLHLHGTHLR